MYYHLRAMIFKCMWYLRTVLNRTTIQEMNFMVKLSGLDSWHIGNFNYHDHWFLSNIKIKRKLGLVNLMLLQLNVKVYNKINVKVYNKIIQNFTKEVPNSTIYFMSIVWFLGLNFRALNRMFKKPIYVVPLRTNTLMISWSMYRLFWSQWPLYLIKITTLVIHANMIML